MNEIIKENQKIVDIIYEVRGVQVMLSSDIAKLYQVETKRINEVIKRNINRFPKSFCFQLTNEEITSLSLRSQIATLNKNMNMRGQHLKYLPYVLTEQGIMMLSGLLKSDIAVKVNIQIIDAFVKMRKYFANTIITNEMLINHENRILKLEESFDKLNEKEKINAIFYEGQIYDAYSLLIDIFKEAKKEIIIIDNYADKSILDMITNLNVKVTIVTKKFNLLKDIDIKKYNRQYHNLKVIYSDKFHDRFVILDKKVLYHSGASFKDLGNKCFAINKIEDNEYLKNILKKIK